MARWRLRASHYLNSPGTEWEYIETSRTTNKPVRRKHMVPLFLDIDDFTMWNDNIIRNPRGELLSGDIAVCHEGKGNPSDVVFVGLPTPDMEPLDAEAQEISDAENKRRNYPVIGADQDLAKVLTESLHTTMEQLTSHAALETSRSSKAMEQLLQQQAEMMAQNQLLMAKLVEAVAGNGTRRL